MGTAFWIYTKNNIFESNGTEMQNLYIIPFPQWQQQSLIMSSPRLSLAAPLSLCSHRATAGQTHSEVQARTQKGCQAGHLPLQASSLSLALSPSILTFFFYLGLIPDIVLVTIILNCQSWTAAKFDEIPLQTGKFFFFCICLKH